MYQGVYQLIGSEMSLFSRKLEAQLRFQRVPFQWLFKTQQRSTDLEARAGTHFIPLLQTPENWMLNDTIALGPMLNQRFNDYPVIPQTALQKASCFILEDAFNHWLGRSCVHSRWCYPDNVKWAGPRFGANMMLDRSIDQPFSEQELQQLSSIGETMYQGFGKAACDYNGVGPDQAAAVKADFQLMLEALGQHFSEHKFLLGARPCLADFALAGACKAHYLCDPEPRSWLGEYQQMLVDYTERFFSHDPIDAGDWQANDELPVTLGVILDYIQRSYLQFATANIHASAAGEKYYQYNYGFGPTKARTQKRLNKARLHVQDELVKMGAQKHAKIIDVYGSRGILQHYLA
ncbi:glutathione S-transferase family protein [Porticoccaceae bacterium]|nr:glutathione S-transferase family protein [Porticoccaceae bacterium]MDC0590238.1 glutathione S-transferase family protein [Porticoccaceae bacterium]